MNKIHKKPSGTQTRLLLCFLCGLAGCASAPPENAEAAKARSDAAASDVICRKENVTGSHFPKKVCYTRDQLREMKESADRAMDAVRTTSQPTSGS